MNNIISIVTSKEHIYIPNQYNEKTKQKQEIVNILIKLNILAI